MDIYYEKNLKRWLELYHDYLTDGSDTRVGKLPDVIVAGFMKCGSTAMWNLLNRCDDVNVSVPVENVLNTSHECYNIYNYPKEIKYFSDGKVNKHFDLSWYKRHFISDGKPCVDIDQAIGQDLPGAGEKWSRVLDPVIQEQFTGDIIFLVRNPIDRAWSQWLQYKSIFPRSDDWGVWYPDESFIYNLINSDQFIRDYVYNINMAVEHFGASRVHVLVSERLKPKWPQVVDTLGNSGENGTKLDRIQPEYVDVGEYDRLFDIIGVPRKNSDQIKAGLHYGTAHVRPTAHKLSPADREQCRDIFKPQVEQLFNITGVIDEWVDFA